MTTRKPLVARIAAVVALPMVVSVGLSLAPAASAAPATAAPVGVVVPDAAPQVAIVAAAGSYYNAATVALHNVAATDCWVIISGNVYNMTAYLPLHSGGSSKISPYCGGDGTSKFTGQHGSLTSSVKTARTGNVTTTFGAFLSNYLVGTLDNAVPTTPAGVAATPGNGQVGLTWTASTDAASGVTGYQILQGGTQVGTSSTNSYTATGLTNGTLYSFTVKAVDAAGNVSPASAVATATPLGAVPAVPTMSAPVAGDGQVTLSWSTSAGATSYQVFRSATQIATVTAPTTTYTATGLTNGTQYSFTVKAVNASGASAASSPATTATPMPAIPLAPTNLTATPGNALVSLSWTASAGATSYTVFRGVTQIGTVNAPTTSYTATGLTNGTQYSFTVKAVNMSGTSGASAAATATPTVPATAPLAPTGLAAVPTSGQVALSWNASAGATSYVVLKDNVQIATPSATTYTATGLTNGTAYTFTVKAVNAVGTSPASTGVNSTPIAVPLAPANLAAAPGSTQVVLTWNASAGATSYVVLKDNVQIATPSATTYTATGLTNGTSYAFTVKAVNGSGTSPASTVVNSTPVAVPLAPTNLAATPLSAQVTLAWDASAGATSYVVLKDNVQIATPSATTYTATGLTNGTSYAFTVKAVNGSGTSPASTAVTVAPVAVPAPPTGLTAKAGNAKVDLTWDASAGATSYEVYSGATLLGTAPTATYSATGLTNGTAYTFTVKAINGSGRSAASAGVTATPAAPVTPTATFTAATLALHATEKDCWVAIGGTVYNLTDFLLTHSGGSGVIASACGGDGTTTFYTRHGGSADAKFVTLAPYMLGTMAGYVAAPLPQQAAAPTVDAVVGGGQYTMDEVKAHNTAADCWTVIGDGVFGLSTWIPVHPGGSSVVVAMCGIDSTAMYNGKHGGSGSAGDILAKIRMGTLVASKPKPVVTYAATDVTAHNTAADCWSIVNGSMYDLTAWIPKHPGGTEVVIAMCGTDGTAMYNGKHGGSAGANAALDAYKLGVTQGELPAPSTTAATAPIVKVITARRVQAHNEVGDCWTIVNGNVYNLTPWTKKHPGRKAFITSMCGRNGSSAFNKTTGSVAKSTKVLKRYFIGRVGRPTATPAATPVAPSATYTLTDVAAHKAVSSCWSVVSGNVYDLTSWIPLHPGGSGSIVAMCGKDGSTSYNAMHKGSAKAAAALAKYLIGKLG